MIKVFELNNEYAIRLIVETIRNSQKIIEKDLFKTFSSDFLLKQYLGSIVTSLEYKKAKIFFNYITNKIIIENIIPEIDCGSMKDFLKEKINLIYPNHKLKYDNYLKEVTLKNKKKQYTITLIPKEIQDTINIYFSSINQSQKVYGYDLILFQDYLTKNKHLFTKKYLLIIQKDYVYWRFFEVLGGVVINYLIMNEENDCFKEVTSNILGNIEKAYDEVIIDADYKTYISFNEKYPLVNITYVDFIPKLKNIDERKINYAKS